MTNEILWYIFSHSSNSRYTHDSVMHLSLYLVTRLPGCDFAYAMYSSARSSLSQMTILTVNNLDRRFIRTFKGLTGARHYLAT